MKKVTKLLSLVLVPVISIVFFSTVVMADTTVVTVSEDTSAGENQPGWLFNRDISTSTPFEFNTDEASIGVGSLYVLPIGVNAADKFIAENFVLSPITDINTISYDFLIGSGGTAADENQFYMSVYANYGESDPLKFYDCRYSVVPTAGSISNWTTVTFDPTESYPVTTRSSSPYACPAKPADMNLQSPNSTIRVFAINVGDTSTNDVGLDGYLDNVVVSTTSGTEVSDFEPTLTPIDKNECKKNGWTMFNSPVFKNQGDCVSYVVSNENAKGNKNK